jgi:hypothetical protein
MKKLILSFCACCVVYTLVWAGTECSRAKSECEAAKADAVRKVINCMNDIRCMRDVITAQNKADNICGHVWGICEAERIEEERKREEERRRREEERARNNRDGL